MLHARTPSRLVPVLSGTCRHNVPTRAPKEAPQKKRSWQAVLVVQASFCLQICCSGHGAGSLQGCLLLLQERPVQTIHSGRQFCSLCSCALSPCPVRGAARTADPHSKPLPERLVPGVSHAPAPKAPCSQQGWAQQARRFCRSGEASSCASAFLLVCLKP